MKHLKIDKIITNCDECPFSFTILQSKQCFHRNIGIHKTIYNELFIKEHCPLKDIEDDEHKNQQENL